MNVDNARKFSFDWHGHGNEERETQKFWFALLRDVFGVDKPEKIIEPNFPVQFEKSTGYIDIYLPRTKVIIEQKSLGVDLDEKIRQSDGENLTPFEQAKRYAEAMPYSTRPRWIVTCNFDEFRIYDLAEMNSLEYLSGTKTYKPEIVKLAELHYAYQSLEFLVNPNAKLKPEVKISIDAAKIVKKICRAIDPDYVSRDDEYIDTLCKFCARLVFCFYADDENLFTQIKFDDWLQKIPTENLRDELQKLFDTLNSDDDTRPENLDDDLKKFPCVDGGLFDEELDLPPLNEGFGFAVRRAHNLDNLDLDELGNLLRFSWREISPPIFGAMFESLFNVDTRRTGGIHYTTPENIRKVIDPLFLDDLSNELAEIKRKRKKNRIVALQVFQDKLAKLTFLDPACGSGNFLTETYLCLRALENEALAELRRLGVKFTDDPIKVTPLQFFGIEINDFAVAVAKDALWISEIQMLRKTSWIIGRELPDLPLRKDIFIRKANALRVDWKKVFGSDAPETFDYIIGNPPVVGGMMTNSEQKSDLAYVWGETQGVGEMDYVTCWYKKAADLIRGTETRCAFVSTNSITQGQQACTIWQPLFAEGIHLDFAHKTFRWTSESEAPAHVHCVVIGFSCEPNDKDKKIFDGDNFTLVQNINPYLIDGEIIFIKSRSKPLCKVPPMCFGSMPRDGGHLIIEAKDVDIFLRDEPAAEKFIRRYVGANEFIKGKLRYCLWLVDVPAEDWRKLPLVVERVEACGNFRMKSKAAATRNFARTPQLFCQIAQPTTNYILVPRVSSERRRYVPIGFMPPTVIASDATLLVPDATLYHFGVLTSSVHMAWMRTVCGRLESRYRYSKDIVYNNFPWPTPTASQQRLIEQSAQAILDARAKFPTWTFAKLYDENTMPDELRSAHYINDFNVALAYGFKEILTDEAKVVAELMKLYAALA